MLKVNYFIFIFLALSSCGQNNEPFPEEKELISFTTSPIDLSGLDVLFAQDIFYDTSDLNTFDIFLPESNSPTGLVIYYHGGGFNGGDKSNYYASQNIVNYQAEFSTLLESGIAIATVNYRLIYQSSDGGVLKAFNDSKRALQFIRSISDKLNIKKENIAVTGNSAGAGISLWLSTSDEMAEPESADTVLRESTRVKAVALRETQSSYDFRSRWVDDIFSEYGITWDHFLANYSATVRLLLGIAKNSDYDNTATEEYRKKIDMISHLTSDDPEMWIENTRQPSLIPIHSAALLHHPYFVRELMEKAEEVSVKHVAYYGDPVIYADPSGEGCADFLKRKILED